MRKLISKILIISLFVGMFSSIDCFAGKLDASIPQIPSGTISLDTDGTVTFTPPTYTRLASVSGTTVEVSQWRKFEAQLLKRVSTVQSGTTVYSYKTNGSICSCTADDNEIDVKYTSTGYYQVQVRGVNLEGNYSNWSWISGAAPAQKISDVTAYEGVPISEDDLSIGGGGGSSGSGASGDSSSGPGAVQTGNLPAGYQYAVVGPNGEILYYYAGNTSYGQYYGTSGGAYQYQQNGSQYLGPGYANNMQGGGQVLYPNTGISNYQQVESPYIYSGNNQQQNYNNQGYNNQGYNNQGYNNQGYNNQGYNNQGYNNNPNNNSSIYNPNYSNQNTSPSNNNSYASPQITQGLEIGWHVDNNGRFYYQGNGEVLKSTWYLIDNNYYRFADNGYLLCNQWYKDNNTGYWYYLAGDGRMLTGWQCLNGTWYYFKPQNGNGYGTMYANTSLYIEDKQWGNGQYAFDANGAMVRNAWYGGYYYNNDGRRAN